MKTYIVIVDGLETSKLIKASGFNAAEKKAKSLYPGKSIQVIYTEV